MRKEWIYHSVTVNLLPRNEQKSNGAAWVNMSLNGTGQYLFSTQARHLARISVLKYSGEIDDLLKHFLVSLIFFSFVLLREYGCNNPEKG